MQNDKNPTPAAFIFNACRQGFLNSVTYTAVVFLILTLLTSSAIAEKTKSEQLLDQQRFLAYEMAGISLSTPLESIPSILKSHGYTQTGNITYTKQVVVPGQRKAVYRIEVDDTPAQRQITYFRGQSGGRVKSSALQEKPIQLDEIEMANELYEIVCTEITSQVQETRTCQPTTEALIIFGHGKLLEIGKNFSAQLNASANSTTIGLKVIKE
jgi:hypothetical protein